MLKKVQVLGAGPVGLYFAGYLKRIAPQLEIEVFEKRDAIAHKQGAGYTLPDEMFTSFGEVAGDCGSSLRQRATSDWSTVTLQGYRGFHERRFMRNPLRGILRSTLLSTLHETIVAQGVPVHFPPFMVAEPADDTLVVHATGAGRSNDSVEADIVGMAEQSVPLSYQWRCVRRESNQLDLIIRKVHGVPFTMHRYPVSSDQEAQVIQILETNVERYCSTVAPLLGSPCSPEEFSKVRMRTTATPGKLQGRYLLGEAAFTHYFGTGEGLYFALGDAKHFADVLASTLSLDANALTCATAQHNANRCSSVLQRSLFHANQTYLVLKHFDELSEGDHIDVLSARKTIDLL